MSGFRYYAVIPLGTWLSLRDIVAAVPSHGVALRPGALRAARRAKGLTQEELGNVVGQSALSIGMWETGKREPRRATMLRLAAALQVAPGELAVDLGNPEGLRERREAAGLTLHELAAVMGVTSMTISRWQRSGLPARMSEADRELLDCALRGDVPTR